MALRKASEVLDEIEECHGDDRDIITADRLALVQRLRQMVDADIRFSGSSDLELVATQLEHEIQDAAE